MRFLFFLISLIFLISYPLSAQTVIGIVFEDKNENSLLDQGEKGLPNISVSNGTQVVQTDKKGRYELPIDDDDIIFVIKPRDDRPPVDSLNLPQFFYLHKPNGSPELEYPGVAPTGELPLSVNFPLISAAEPDSFKMLYFGDPQTPTTETVSFFTRSIVRELIGVEGYMLGLTLGDIVGDDLSLFHPINEAVAKIGIPWYNIYGNHDMNLDAPHDSLADETFEWIYGPANYSFNYGKVHFVVLDDVMFPRPDGKPSYVGGLHQWQLDFLENDLKYVPKDYLVVIHMHIPIFLQAFYGETFRKADRDRLFELLKDFPHNLSLSAHSHQQQHFFYGKEDGWLQEKAHHHFTVGTTCGDWWCGELDAEGIPESTMRDGTPKGYLIMDFNGNSYSYEYKAYGKPANYKMRLYAPMAVRQGNRTTGELIVNFFQGHEKDKVSYRIDGGEWKKMNRFETTDPYMSTIQYKWDHTLNPPEGRRPSNPVNSKHIWKTRLATNLSIGLHTIEVKAEDFLGRTYFDKTTYRIVK